MPEFPATGPENLGKSARRVREALDRLELDCPMIRTTGSGRTAVEAARELGCNLEQIAKSLIFRGSDTDRALLVVVNGASRVDETKLAGLAGEPIARPDAAFVRERTGFAIGGVPPVAHLGEVTTWFDRTLRDHGEIFAAAGAHDLMFRMSVAQMDVIAAGRYADVIEVRDVKSKAHHP